MPYFLVLIGLIVGCKYNSVEDKEFSHKVYMKIEDTLDNGNPLQVLYYRKTDNPDSIIGVKRIRYWPGTDIPFYEADYEKEMIVDKDQNGTVTGIKFQNGPYLNWKGNGQLVISGHYKKGLRDGTWTLWDEQGEIELIRTFRNDSLIKESSKIIDHNGN